MYRNVLRVLRVKGHLGTEVNKFGPGCLMESTLFCLKYFRLDRILRLGIEGKCILELTPVQRSSHEV